MDRVCQTSRLRILGVSKVIAEIVCVYHHLSKDSKQLQYLNTKVS